VAGKHRRLHVIALGQLAVELGLLAAGEQFRPFLLADVDIGQDLLELIVRRLRPDHGGRIERIALLDLVHARDRLLHELVVDRALHQRARRTGADFALVQREHGETFERLVEEVVVLGHHVGEENVGRLAAELECDRDQVVGLGVLGYIYYQHTHRDVVKIDVPGFQGEISKDKGIDIEVGKDR